MASRSRSLKATVLTLPEFGEGHREALLLTESEGLLRAAVFGGAKSKLRGLVAPYQTGVAWLYSDPVKKSHKITDFDVTAWRPAIRESLVRTWCAALCAELCSRTHGTADWVLVNGFLDGIDRSSDAECRRGLLRFLWRILSHAGVAPDLSACARCCRIGTAVGQNGENEVLYYSPYEDACLCALCARAEERNFPIPAEAAAYLRATADREAREARALSLGPESEAALRNFLFFLASRLVGGSLRAVETGEGII